MTRRILLATSLLLAACGTKQPTVDEALKTWEPKVGSKLAAIEAIAKQPGAGQAATWAKLALVETYPKVTGDTVLIYAADLAALVSGAAPAWNSDRHTSADTVIGCWYAMRKREFGSFELSNSRLGAFSSVPLQGAQVELLCRELAQASYLAVVRPAAAVARPSVATPDDPGKTADSFARGATAGVVDVFELASGKDLGRRPYDAASSSEVLYKTDGTGGGSAMAAEDAAGRDLTENTWKAIERAIEGG